MQMNPFCQKKNIHSIYNLQIKTRQIRQDYMIFYAQNYYSKIEKKIPNISEMRYIIL